MLLTLTIRSYMFFQLLQFELLSIFSFEILKLLAKILILQSKSTIWLVSFLIFLMVHHVETSYDIVNGSFQAH